MCPHTSVLEVGWFSNGNAFERRHVDKLEVEDALLFEVNAEN